jgi:transposase, IS5 family
MLRTRNDQPTLWDAIIPPELLELPELLTKVDQLLDDERFFAAFVPHFHATEGRPSIPMETYLRLMFLKYRYRLGYEPLVAEVADSLTWRRFCRIPLGERVPHPTTLMKITTRCGAEAVEQLNDVLLEQAAQARLVRMHKVRVDTTVIEADVAYPTDSGLLAKAITRLGATVTKVKAAGGARRTPTRDRSRAAGRRARSIAANLSRRTGEAKDEVKRITGDLAELAGTAAAEAKRVISNAKRTLRGHRAATGRLHRAVEDLETLVTRTTKIIEQTRTRLAGDTPPGATRLVSLHDPDARPIVKGRLGKPVEFGYKAQITDNVDGLVLDYDVHIGNPPDAGLLVGAIERAARRIGKVPRAVTADRGYGETGIDDQLTELGVATVAIPRKAKPSAARREIERQPSFRRLVKWRTGAEGRISALKRGYGMDRTRIDGIAGARTWTGHGVLTHNLVHLAAMT